MLVMKARSEILEEYLNLKFEERLQIYYIYAGFIYCMVLRHFSAHQGYTALQLYIDKIKTGCTEYIYGFIVEMNAIDSRDERDWLFKFFCSSFFSFFRASFFNSFVHRFLKFFCSSFF